MGNNSHSLSQGFSAKERLTYDQVRNAQQYFDYRVTNQYNISLSVGGDVNVILKDSSILVDIDKLDTEKMQSLIDELETAIKGSGLEHYVADKKTSKVGLSDILSNIMNEGSWFRRGIASFSDAQAVIERIVQLMVSMT